MLVWLKLKGMTGHWLVQHTAPVRGSGLNQMVCHVYRGLRISCLHPTHHAYISTHLPVLFLSLG